MANENDIALVVSSCDKYADAWYPYFELIKKYWPGHPKKIYLITEGKKFYSTGLDITVSAYDKSLTWSEMLYKTLSKIDSKYIIFSLEDFFLLDYVKQERIDECVTWMEENPQIAVCRFFSCGYDSLIPTDTYKDFRIAGKDISFRLETQFALWNRETLMSFIDLSENPWQFEKNGTERIKDTDKIFLWKYSKNPDSPDDKIVYYFHGINKGYGIVGGEWMWNNKKWFEKNGIYDINYKRLGVISEKAAKKRIKHLYNSDPTTFDKMVRPIWLEVIRIKKCKNYLFGFGLKEGIELILGKTKKQIKGLNHK